jgi:hypothetical protein
VIRFLASREALGRSDDDRGADPHAPEEPFRLAREHPDAAVGARVADGRTIGRPVNADSAGAQAHPSRSERVPRPRWDRLETVSPARVGRIPPRVADLARDREASERRRVGVSPRADGQSADEFGPVVEEQSMRAATNDDHGPELRPRDRRPDPLDPNANGRAIESPEPTDERPNEARPHDSTPGVGTTDPWPQAMEADEPGISWRLADAFIHDGRIAPDARGANVDSKPKCGPRTGVQRPLHGPVHPWGGRSRRGRAASCGGARAARRASRRPNAEPPRPTARSARPRRPRRP